MSESLQFFSVEGAGSTFVHPIGLAMLLVCGSLLVALPRRYAIWAFLVLLCFVATRQAIAIAGFNLYFPRVMILVFGVARGVLRGDAWTIRINRLDWLVIAYGALYFGMGAFNWSFEPSVMKTRSGYVSEVVGTYFLCRMLIRDLDDLRALALGVALIAMPLFAFFAIERVTGRNLFSIFGGVPAITEIRGERLRCQGAFGHPILAGVFWASLLPFMIYGVIQERRVRWLFIAGLVTAMGVIYLTASSTPALAAVTALAGWMLYPLRRYSKWMFASVGVLIVILHMVMKAPVWSLIQRINVTTGNSGYHRYILVDGFIRHAHEWWLLGSRVGTQHWGHFTFDTANQFVSVGISGGIVTFAAFIAMIVVAMNSTGRIAERSPHLGWAVGVSIFTLVVSFFGISIWGQLHFAWSLPLAIAGSLGFRAREIAVRAAAPSEQGRRQVYPAGLAGRFSWH